MYPRCVHIPLGHVTWTVPSFTHTLVVTQSVCLLFMSYLSIYDPCLLYCELSELLDASASPETPDVQAQPPSAAVDVCEDALHPFTSPVQAMSVPLPISRATSNRPSLKDSPIPLSPEVLTPPSARSLELPAIGVSPHNLGRSVEELPPLQDRTTVPLLRPVADARTPNSSPESTIQ
jgi:hypothetical protein